jgi:hypothetical protein
MRKICSDNRGHLTPCCPDRKSAEDHDRPFRCQQEAWPALRRRSSLAAGQSFGINSSGLGNHEYRYSEGAPNRLPTVVGELVRRPVDLSRFGSRAVFQVSFLRVKIGLDVAHRSGY